MTASRARLRFSTLVLALAVLGPAVALGDVEIGGSPPSPAPADDRNVQDLEVMIGPTFDHLIFTDQAMADTYGTAAIPGVKAVAIIADRARFTLSAGYGFAVGNPFYDVTGYEGGDEAKLSTIPLQFGLQGDLSRHPRLHILYGLAAELVWMRERLPAVAVADAADRENYDGWGTGLRFSFGPEWRTADAGRAVGLTMGWGAVGGEVSRDGRRHDVNLSGVGLQLHILWRP